MNDLVIQPITKCDIEGPGRSAELHQGFLFDASPQNPQPTNSTPWGGGIEGCRFGVMAEYRFIIRAMELGYSVCMPVDPSSRYDCIVEKGGRMAKVQVKATKTVRANGSAKISIIKDSKASYLQHEVDTVAAYVEPFSRWYVIPFRCIDQKSLFFYPSLSAGPFQECCEDWGGLIPAGQAYPPRRLAL